MSSSTPWVLEAAHTHIGFSVRHLGLTSTPGVFKQFSAQLHFHAQNIEASRVTFEVETASIDTALEVRDHHLRGADWFNVQAHPKSVFISHAVRRTGDDRYTIEGDLSLCGVTLPATFEATLTGHAVNPWTQAPVVGFKAATTISRSAYGMKAFPGAIADEVHLVIETELTPKND